MHRPRNLNMEMPSSAGRPSLVAPRPTVRVTPLIIHLVPVVAAIKSSQPASGGWDTGVRSVSLALHVSMLHVHSIGAHLSLRDCRMSIT
jgi:hypothetical protein